MTATVIENPVINSPFAEPERHFRFDDDGITNEIVAGRRPSSYFVPIAAPKKRGKQLAFETEWTRDRIEENRLVNDIRRRVALWRQGGYPGVTPTTARLLDYWTDPEREKKLFFCQVEALETAIYLTEAAKKYGDAWLENRLREENAKSNPGLPRIALKMATGSGKTVVMAMLIAWQTLNKLANPQDARFADAFLIVTPGITIRDRLRVLRPEEPDNYYAERDVVPAYHMEDLGRAKIVITNFHAFLPREKIAAASLTKKLLANGGESAFTETPAEVVRRVCRELGTKKHIVVLNDEAHHCYRRKPEADEDKLAGEERVEAKKREEEARIWISGIEAVKAKIGLKAIYDLSATPFFLRGSGYAEGTLFPWVVSDFSLIDAIEAGIVKVPRVPVSDDSMSGEQPTYRDLWLRIRDQLPKKSARTDAISGEPKLPVELEGALVSLYANYEHSYRRWEADTVARANGATPPVFIVVCNNTNVSKLVFDHVAGWEKRLDPQTAAATGNASRVQAGRLEIFRNDDGAGGWLDRPSTILVDSAQLESGGVMSPEFKTIASREIDELKADYRRRFPGRDAEEITDEDLLREVMNTVGKRGRLGEQVKCVVSVSMLTEGWDANTVTHVLGVRAFGTQLLCEQVVGRALRRMSYALNEQDRFDPEYAEVFGVPFSFIPSSGAAVGPKPGPVPTRVRALADRIACEIGFPRLLGYRYEVGERRLSARFTEDSMMALSPYDVPTRTQSDPIIGESVWTDLYGLKEKYRANEVAFWVAKRVLSHYFSDDDGNAKPWFFPQVLAITKRWIAECVRFKDNAFLQMLMLTSFQAEAADKIYTGIVQSAEGAPLLKPILRPYDTLGSTRYVDFDTTRPVMLARADKCHISHVVADTDSWEQKLAQTIEEMPEVIRYVKNQSLGFTIPYVMNGEEHNYVPDFIACLNDGRGPDDLLNLLIEVTGEKKKDKAQKVATARNQWVPAVNNHGAFGRWTFVEITDPWDAANTIRGLLRAHAG
jgi:type III restriction enzyme